MNTAHLIFEYSKVTVKLFRSALLANCVFTSTIVAQILDPLVITATRVSRPQSELPFIVDVFNAENLGSTPAMAIDDMLKSSAAFSLFRRAGSLSANPTSQGVSLRNLGPSGAGRTLVLIDGIPLNDPFGGWVSWSKVPRQILSHAEIVRNGGSSVWGNSALAGTIQFITTKPSHDSAANNQLQLEVGDFGTVSAELTSKLHLDENSLRVSVRSFNSEGFNRKARGAAGPVDQPTDLEYNSVQMTWTHAKGSGPRSTLTARIFSEDRGNGTALQRNHTHDALLSAQIKGQGILFEHEVDWSISAYFQTQEFSNLFTTVSADRSTEAPVLDQYAVPAETIGAAFTATWNEDSSITTAGADMRWVEGETGERYFVQNGDFSRERHAGGTQYFTGIFASHDRDLTTSIRTTISARYDIWRFPRGYRHESEIDSGTVILNEKYAERSGSKFSSSAGVTWNATKTMSWRTAVYQAFRVPTLNELYRPFRIGSTITNANPNLQPETLVGIELGPTWSNDQNTFRITAFTNDLNHPITNVTLGSGPGFVPNVGFIPAGGVGRRRENISSVQVQGVEISGAYRPQSLLKLSIDYLYSDATNLTTGKRLPQVPRHTITTSLDWRPLVNWRVRALARHESDAFEDDLNTLPLGSFTSIDLRVSHDLNPTTTVFLAIENLFNETIITRRTTGGQVDLGTPRFARIGVRRVW